MLSALAVTMVVVPANGQGPETPAPKPAVTPTVDRLAAPPTVEHPTQADEGAQLFWLHCQPCHGDQGQGLTDEWRAQYPPEDQNCWERGCHGNRPYENGFTLPSTVPAVIGDGSLARFESMGQVYVYAKAAMPLQNPAHLSEEEYLAITAFLARGRELWTGVPEGVSLDATNSWNILLKPPAAEVVKDQETATIEARSGLLSFMDGGFGAILLAGVIGLFLLVIGSIFLWRRLRQ